MKLNRLLTFLFFVLLLNVQAQDLKIDFGPTGSANETGYQAYNATHENAGTFTKDSYTAFSATVDVLVSWPAGTSATTMQAINRSNTTGSPDLLGDWMGTDTRVSAGGHDSLMITLFNLPAGTYKWTSRHHDSGDQFGNFATILNDADGTTTSDTLTISKGDLTLDEVTSLCTTFRSNGTDSVVLTFNHVVTDGLNSTAFFIINGFSLEAADNIWNGTTWSGGTPDDTEFVILNDDYSLDTDGVFAAKDILISAGSNLTVDGGNTLDVKECIINSGSMTVSSGSSLLTYTAGTVTGNSVTVERNTRYSDGKYSFVGTPVQQSGANTGADLGSFVYKYDETTVYGADGLSRWVDASADTLVPGRGYTQAGQQLVSFSGIPNSGTVTYSGSYTASGSVEGFNLVSNPYPAAINAPLFISGNANATGTLYIWDDNGSNTGRGTDSDYITVNNLGLVSNGNTGSQTRYNAHIGSGQAFFVKFDDNTNTNVVFTESMRVSGNNADANFFRTISNPIVRLSLSGEQVYNETLIGFADDAAETGRKSGYDAQKFSANEKISFYSLKGEDKLAIQGLPSYLNKEIALGFFVAESGEYSFKLNEIEQIENAMPYLVDKLTGRSYALSNQQNVTFSLASGENNNRFSLMLLGTAKLAATNDFLASYDGQYLNLEFGADLSNAAGEVTVYDVSGEVIAVADSKSLSDLKISGAPLAFDALYLIKVITNEGEVNRKFIFTSN